MCVGVIGLSCVGGSLGLVAVVGWMGGWGDVGVVRMDCDGVGSRGQSVGMEP